MSHMDINKVALTIPVSARAALRGTFVLFPLLIVVILLLRLPDKLKPPELCGIPLAHPKAVEVLSDVKQQFHKSVTCQIDDLHGEAECGQAEADDGTPHITLDKGCGNTETEIVHELFHLQLKAKGFPAISKAMVRQAPDVRVVKAMASLIEHLIFYPEMQKMGFNPAEGNRDQVEYSIEYSKEHVIDESRQALAFLYAATALQVNDEKLIERVGRWYREQGWNEPLDLGRAMAQYLSEFRPNTPAKKRTAVEFCVKKLFGPDMVILEWETQINGVKRPY